MADILRTRSAPVSLRRANNARVKRRKQGNPNVSVLHVAGPDVGRTLADVVSQKLKVARGEAERRILTGLVTVHGNVCADGDRRLRGGDVIHVRGGEAQRPAARTVVPQIDFQDNDLLIVDKPAGVTSVREPGDRRNFGRAGRDPSPTLDELLQKRLGQGVGVRVGVRVRPVHRLDRDTSGLMVFALSPAAASALSADFKAHRIDRAYRAVVRGTLDAPRTINTLLVRDRGDGKRGSLPPGVADAPGAQRAVTHVRPVERFGDGFSVVECRLETGRTHQIRIHLSEIGHALCGDPMYGPRDDTAAPRQALHACRLGLTHPTTGRPLAFESDWPADLRRWLDDFRSRPRRS